MKTIYIHLGAGSGDDLPAIMAMAPTKVVLVEADEANLRALRQRTHRDPTISVIEATIGGDAGQRDFHVLSHRDFSGLGKPSGLYRLFPGIEIIDRYPVSVRPVTDLLSKFDLSAYHRAILVIETPGIARDILKAIEASGDLLSFTELRIMSFRDEAFEGEGDSAAIAAFFDGKPFDVAINDTQDSDMPVVEAMLNRGALLAACNAETKALKARLTEQETALGKAHADLTKAHNAAADEAAQRTLMTREIERLTAQLDLLKDLIVGKDLFK